MTEGHHGDSLGRADLTLSLINSNLVLAPFFDKAGFGALTTHRAGWVCLSDMGTVESSLIPRPCTVGDAPRQGFAFNPRAGPCTMTPSGAFLLLLPSSVTTVPAAFPVGLQLIPNPSGVRLEDKQRSPVLKPVSPCLFHPSAAPAAAPCPGAILSTHHSQCWPTHGGAEPAG